MDHLVLTEEDLNAFFAEHRRLRGLRLELKAGAVRVALTLPGPDVTGRLRLLAGPAGTSAGDRGPVPTAWVAPLTIQAEQLSVGGIPLPELLTQWVLRHYDPAPRLAKLSVALELGTVRVERAHRDLKTLSARDTSGKLPEEHAWPSRWQQRRRGPEA